MGKCHGLNRLVWCVLPAVSFVALDQAARGQAVVDLGGPSSYPAPAWMETLMPDPDDPRVQAFYKQQRELAATRLELVKLGHQYFDKHQDMEQHQLGLLKLREEYNKPEMYPLMLEVFAKADEDVRTGILDLFVDASSDEGDGAIAWEAVFEKDEAIRRAAVDRLVSRMQTRQQNNGSVPDSVKYVVAAGLQEDNNDEVLAAAGVSEMLNLYEMIPLLIAAQVGGDTRGAQRERAGNLAWIMIAQQQSFVSDLTPVVGNNAVAFDPTLSVVTNGVVLEVKDAIVLTYRTEVFYTLTRMASKAMGKPQRVFAKMKIDEAKWRQWYQNEWKPWYATNKTRLERLPVEG